MNTNRKQLQLGKSSDDSFYGIELRDYRLNSHRDRMDGVRKYSLRSILYLVDAVVPAL